MIIGYMRVSKDKQNKDLQADALTKAGCERIFEDEITGSTFERKGLNEALAFVRSGDTLVVWKLDRLGRSLIDLIKTINLLKEKGIEFRSLTESIDTTTPIGKFTFHLMGALAEFERDLIRERTNAGLAAARDRGHVGGRPQSLTPVKIKQLKKLYESREHDIPEICQTMGISRSTLYRYVK